MLVLFKIEMTNFILNRGGIEMSKKVFFFAGIILFSFSIVHIVSSDSVFLEFLEDCTVDEYNAAMSVGFDFTGYDGLGQNAFALILANDNFKITAALVRDMARVHGGISQAKVGGVPVLLWYMDKILRDDDVLSALLQAGASPSGSDYWGNTVLHMVTARNINTQAASPFPKAVVNAALKAGVSLESRNNDGMTPLLAAAQHADYTAIAEFLALKARQDAEDKLGRTAPVLLLNTILYPSGASADDLKNEIHWVYTKSGIDFSKTNKAGLLPHQALLKFLSPQYNTDSYRRVQASSLIVFLDYLLGKGIDLRTADREGYTPLGRLLLFQDAVPAYALLSNGFPADSGPSQDMAKLLEKNPWPFRDKYLVFRMKGVQ